MKNKQKLRSQHISFNPISHCRVFTSATHGLCRVGRIRPSSPFQIHFEESDPNSLKLNMNRPLFVFSRFGCEGLSGQDTTIKIISIWIKKTIKKKCETLDTFQISRCESFRALNLSRSKRLKEYCRVLKLSWLENVSALKLSILVRINK